MTRHLIDGRRARRLALARAGLLRPERTALPTRAGRGDRLARRAACAIIERFGYLQLDTVPVSGARSHVLVLLSRLDGFRPDLGEALLRPGTPLFEYWGHEASWIPLDLYPAFEFRRREFREHPWWGDVVGEHPRVARLLLDRIRAEGPLRSSDMDGQGGRGWWDLKVAKRVASALWSSGTLAIRERRSFLRSYDLTERVIPASHRQDPLALGEALEVLALRALGGHGWASTGTIAATFRLSTWRKELEQALERLVDDGRIIQCDLDAPGGSRSAGWIRPGDLELAESLARARPRGDRGVLLSPFDPVLWDRARVKRLFGFNQVLEIYKPRAQRVYGYYCLPVLAGDRLVARVDLKADRKAGRVRVLSCHWEKLDGRRSSKDRVATRTALARHATSLDLELAFDDGAREP